MSEPVSKDGWITVAIKWPASEPRIFIDGIEWPESMTEEDFWKHHDEQLKKLNLRG